MVFGTDLDGKGADVSRVNAVLAVFASLALASTPTGAGVAAASTFTEFRTPSGNILCALNIEGVTFMRCDIASFTYPPPRPTDTCDVPFGHTVAKYGVNEAPSFQCSHDTMSADVGVPVLAYGDSITLDTYTCDSTAEGVRCVDHYDDHSFTLSRDSYQFA